MPAAKSLNKVDAVVQPQITPDTLVEAMQQYQELCSKILDHNNDIQVINGQNYKKKSAWRKLALAYNISWEITGRELLSNDRAKGVMYRMKAIAPNGRTSEAEGFATNMEKGMQGKPFSYVVMYAQTRALNKALAEMISPGELPAEEMTDVEPEAPRANFTAFMKLVKSSGTSVDEAKEMIWKRWKKNIQQCSQEELDAVSNEIMAVKARQHLEVF